MPPGKLELAIVADWPIKTCCAVVNGRFRERAARQLLRMGKAIPPVFCNLSKTNNYVTGHVRRQASHFRGRSFHLAAIFDLPGHQRHGGVAVVRACFWATAGRRSISASVRCSRVRKPLLGS